VPKVFISYMTEDWTMVARLVESLKNLGVDVWVDRDKLSAGQRWADIIRLEIREGDFFLACFSDAYHNRFRSFMNEELTIAVEELRKRKRDEPWLIPVRLTDCGIPDWPIGSGETLRSLQWANLFINWEEGISHIISIIKPTIEPYDHIYYKYHYRILDVNGYVTIIHTENHLKVLRKRISTGGGAWTSMPEALTSRLTYLDKEGNRISDPVINHTTEPKKKGLFYLWNEKYNPPLEKNQHVCFEYDFKVRNEFTEKECSDSFSAYRNIRKFEWLIDFPDNRPAKRWWATRDYEQHDQDDEPLCEFNQTTKHILWKYGPMAAGAFYYINWEW
jgi:hypothetical protein